MSDFTPSPWLAMRVSKKAASEAAILLRLAADCVERGQFAMADAIGKWIVMDIDPGSEVKAIIREVLFDTDGESYRTPSRSKVT